MAASRVWCPSVCRRTLAFPMKSNKYIVWMPLIGIIYDWYTDTILPRRRPARWLHGGGKGGKRQPAHAVRTGQGPGGTLWARTLPPCRAGGQTVPRGAGAFRADQQASAPDGRDRRAAQLFRRAAEGQPADRGGRSVPRHRPDRRIQ